MAKHYAYRLDHDTGFAPHPSGSRCTLCGCKTTSVERWSQPGSWVIGIGGIRTGKPDALIYAMKVESVLSVATLRRRFPRHAAYLQGRAQNPSNRVLLSHHFYYFGNGAIRLPNSLKSLIVRQQGCKKVSDEEVRRLSGFLSRRFRLGVHGHPNNASSHRGKKCGCR